VSDVRGTTLVRLAREAIATSFDGRHVAVPREPWLDELRAMFVTLRRRQRGELRGCIGTTAARQPLGEAVIAYARLAAFGDRRFDPLTREELDLISIDVSVLSPLTPLPVTSEADAHAKLQRARPGVALSYGHARGVFLPQVWQSLADAADFLRHLKQKAGLPGHFWSEAIALHTFTCEVFAEPETAAPPGEAS
jgi:AmmeMemoRadiSam system protein A